MPINIMFVDSANCVHEAEKWVLKDETYYLTSIDRKQNGEGCSK